MRTEEEIRLILGFLKHFGRDYEDRDVKVLEWVLGGPSPNAQSEPGGNHADSA